MQLLQILTVTNLSLTKTNGNSGLNVLVPSCLIRNLSSIEMEKLLKSDLKLGIIAGGQLAKMLIQEASKWGITSYVLDPEENCPAKNIASVYVKGDYLDFESVYQFGKQVDILTFEIENINIEALKKLKSEGLKIIPDPNILELIQDKGLQKNFYKDQQLPTAHFRFYESKEAIVRAIAEKTLAFPFVQKLRKGGFDGRGVSVINNEADVKKLLNGASLVEEKVDIKKEIAVIVARNESAEVCSYPVVDLIFNPNENVLERLICPANINVELSKKAASIALKIIESLNMVGLLSVEFFIDQQDQILINEIAPRSHNSGHHTIESVMTSQFEQNLRAVLNLPLGSTRLIMPAVMLNLLGEAGYEGPVIYEGLSESLALDGVKIHLYGKKTTRPFRKMGHVTILSDRLEEAIITAEKVKHLIKVKSWKK